MATIQSPYVLFGELRKLIPNLPNHCVKMVLTLELDQTPTVDCTFHTEVDTTVLGSTAREFALAGETMTKRFNLIEAL